MAEPVKKDDALAAAVREAFHRHMENARLASLTAKPTLASLDLKRATSTTAQIRQLELKAEPQAPAAEPAADDKAAAETTAPAKPTAAETGPTAEKLDRPEENRLPSVEEGPSIDLEAALAELEEEYGPAKTAPPASKAAPAPAPLPAARKPAERSEAPKAQPALTPPAAANDRDTRSAGDRLRDRSVALGSTAERERKVDPAPAPARQPEDAPAETLTASRPAIAPPVARPRVAQRREAVNTNQGVHFGTGSRREVVQERSSSRWIVIAALGAASLLCIGIGGYVWISASSPKTGAVEGQAAPQAPAASVAVASPSTKEDASHKVLATLPAQAAPTPEPLAESPVGARTVHTTTIKLDTIDLAVQDARERLGTGDVAAARLILERFRDGGDPRALFALAETYDPSIVKGPGLADPKEAQELYQAAGRAGYAASAERLARLQTN